MKKLENSRWRVLTVYLAIFPSLWCSWWQFENPKVAKTITEQLTWNQTKSSQKGWRIIIYCDKNPPQIQAILPRSRTWKYLSVLRTEHNARRYIVWETTLSPSAQDSIQPPNSLYVFILCLGNSGSLWSLHKIKISSIGMYNISEQRFSHANLLVNNC